LAEADQVIAQRLAGQSQQILALHGGNGLIELIKRTALRP
jgi:hypothetical protein